MKWIVITLVCGILNSFAATPQPKPPGTRYLFVVDTSSAMADLEHGGRQAVFDLIYSGIEKRMRPGDSFGVWTFQEEVSAGVFPVQFWDPANSLALASRTGLFLKGLKYRGKARLDAAYATTTALMRHVKDVNVIFVCSPEAQLKDFTPFPGWVQNAARARKEQKPVIVAMSAVNGEIAQRSVAIEGEALSLPNPPPQLAVTNASVATNLQAKTVRPPIIMQGPARPRVAEVIADTNAVAYVKVETNLVLAAQTANADPQIPAVGEGEAPAEAPRNETSSVVQAHPEKKVSQTPLAALLPEAISVAAREKSETSRPLSQPPLAAATLSWQSRLNPTVLILSGVGLLALVLTLITWLYISSRRRAQLSAISESMNRIRFTK